ncbi:MAG: Gfo/Idh/MocA family oxidoreductase [Anaerolinea sp.]|nr:Gfo/Idh/MocA family oxidoreductase [Anaerolinea sp.]
MLTTELRALVVGAGSIGRRHARNLMQLGITQVALCDPDASRVEQAAAEIAVRTTYADYADALQTFQPEIVFVCTPPVLHVEQSLRAVEAGAHVFVEKPLSNQLDGIDDLIAAAERAKRVVQVGYNLRFHAAVSKIKSLLEQGSIGRVLWMYAEVGQYLPDWRPWQDYRQSYTARRELGGGIILDASHEIDYVLWMLGTPTEIVCIADHVSDLEVNVEDCADLTLRFPDRVQAVIHVDFIQRAYARKCKLVGSVGTIEWDYTQNEVHLLQVENNARQVFKFEANPNQMYLSEIEAFLQAVRTGSTSNASLREAKAVIRVALAALESTAAARVVYLAEDK